MKPQLSSVLRLLMSFVLVKSSSLPAGDSIILEFSSNTSFFSAIPIQLSSLTLRPTQPNLEVRFDGELVRVQSITSRTSCHISLDSNLEFSSLDEVTVKVTPASISLQPHKMADYSPNFSSERVGAPSNDLDPRCVKLAQFYLDMSGDRWFNNSGWSSAAQRNYSDCCTMPWYGLNCLEMLSTITSLALPGNNLKGSNIDLSGLEIWSLDLSSNEIHGILNCSLLPDKLNDLTLGNNSFYGHLCLSRDLASLDVTLNSFSSIDCPDAAMTSMLIGQNELTGTFPQCLTAINQIDAAFNNFKGTLPPIWSEAFDASFNFLEGPLPNWGCGNSWIRLEGNFFTGPIPAVNFTQSCLACFEASGNAIDGTLPGWLPCMDLSYNLLGGTLPPMDAAYVWYVDLSGNQLYGTIPAILSDWPFPNGGNVLLDFSTNNFSGPLPPIPTINCPRFLQLDFSHNSLEGSIPDNFGDAVYGSLSLSGNALTGTVPRSIMQLTSLDVSFNQLSGELVFPGPGLLSFVGQSNFFTGELRPSQTIQILNVESNLLEGCSFEFVPQLTLLNIAQNRYNCSLEELLGFCNPVTESTQAVATGRCSQLLLLDIGGNQFVGTLESALFQMISGALILDFSDNNFNGLLPLGLPNSSWFSLNLQDNADLTGPLPSAYENYPQLTDLQLQGTGLSGDCDEPSPECLPSWLTLLSPFVEVVAQNCSCPSVGSTIAQVHVAMDPQYFKFYGCQCATGFYGSACECKACPAACQCYNRTLQGCYPGVDGEPLECPVGIFSSNPCIANSSSATGMSCAPGYEGRLCSRCTEGHFSTGRSCEECYSWAKYVVPFTLGLLLALLIAYLLMVPGVSTGVLKITIFYLQSLSILLTVGLQWNGLALGSLFHLSTGPALLSLASPDCLVRLDFDQFFYVLLSMPAIITVLIVIIYAIRHIVCRERSQKSKLRWKAQRSYSIGFVWYLFYFELAERILGNFSCTLVDGNSTYMNPYPWVVCSPMQPTYKQAVIVSGIFAGIYIVGIPMYLFVPLWRRRRALTEKPVVWNLGYLYGCYQPKFWFWEGVVLLRRLVLAGLVAVLPFPDPGMIELSAFAVLLFFLLLQVFFQPYSSVLENALESLSLFTVLVSFLTKVILPKSNFLPVLILDLVVFLVMLVFIVRVYYRRLRVLLGQRKELAPLLQSNDSFSAATQPLGLQ